MSVLPRSAFATRTTLQPARIHNARPTHGVRRDLQLQSRQLTRTCAKRATENDERLIEEMKRAAEKDDLLDGGTADVLVKVLTVAGAVGLVVLLAFLGQPVIQNTLAAFPSAS